MIDLPENRMFTLTALTVNPTALPKAIITFMSAQGAQMYQNMAPDLDRDKFQQKRTANYNGRVPSFDRFFSDTCFYLRGFQTIPARSPFHPQ